MYKMDKTVLVQTTEKVLAKATAKAYDLRSQKEEIIFIFCELTEKEQDAKPIVERALQNMGYQYMGMVNVETTTVPFDTEGMFMYGKEREEKDLQRE